MLTSFEIKLIAIATMIIDHIGAFFFPEQMLFRLVGRLSFPLFAWLIANGAHHTRNLSAYTRRIFIFALIAQVPYVMAYELNNMQYSTLNVLFTFGIGLLVLMVIKNTSNKFYWGVAAAIGGLSANFLHTEYGLLGIFSVVAFYIYTSNFRKMVFAQTVLILIIVVASHAAGNTKLLLQPFSLVALIFIYFYGGKQGPKMKWLFYAFFPLHFVLIYLIKIILK